jgi:TfoX/Sxy family transcriptional regulator of competence genes
MATDASFMNFVLGQIEGAGPIEHRKMFGEYALYCQGKVVALVCDNQVFVKPTDPGRALLGEPKMAPPYPGAKPHILIEAAIDDVELFSTLIRTTALALPAPKPKRRPSTAAAKPRAKRTRARTATTKR